MVSSVAAFIALPHLSGLSRSLVLSRGALPALRPDRLDQKSQVSLKPAQQLQKGSGPGDATQPSPTEVLLGNLELVSSALDVICPLGTGQEGQVAERRRGKCMHWEAKLHLVKVCLNLLGGC